MEIWESKTYIKSYRRELSFKFIVSIIAQLIGKEKLIQLASSKVHLSQYMRHRYPYVCEGLDNISILNSTWDLQESEFEGLKILDIGGGGGDNYLMLLPFARKTSWTIVDNPKIHGVFSSRKNILYVSKISELPAGDEFNFLLIRGTLQYLSESQIEDLFMMKIKYVLISRTVISSKDSTYTQIAKVSRKSFEVKNKVYSQEGLTDLMNKYGYRVKVKEHPHKYDLLTTEGVVEAAYISMLFELKS